MDSRQHRRVRLRLPVRLRWTTPFGQKIELASTIDVSRSGALVSTKEPHSKGVMVWLTFPYDASLSDGQPEILARVVRCAEALEVIRGANAREKVQTPSAVEQERSAKLDQLTRAIGFFDAPATFAVAFQFEEQPHSSANGHAHRDEPERRAAPGGRWLSPSACTPNGFPGLKRPWPSTFRQRACAFAVTASTRSAIT